MIMPIGTQADEKPPLPDPLSLAQALSYATDAHPALEKQRAELDLARGNAAAAGADDDLSIRVDAYARWVQPPPQAPDQDQADHQLSLLVRKPLLDFGRSSALDAAAQAGIDAQEQRLSAVQDNYRIEIMRAFFDVVLADLRFNRENEDMAVAFIRFDRTRQRQSLGQRSELEVRETRSTYEKVRRARYYAQTQQRATRNRLAFLLGFATNLPANVTAPELALNVKGLPDYDALLALALDNNAILHSQRAAAVAAEQKLLAAQRDYWPTVDAELEMSKYSRQFGSRDDWRAAMKLSVPLYNGNRVSAKILQEQARFRQLQAVAAQSELDLRQQLLDLWLYLDTLGADRDLAKASYDYRQLKLDEARTLYEQEKQADLGDSMVQTSEARWQVAKIEFDIAITWAKVQALTGQPINLEQGLIHDKAQ